MNAEKPEYFKHDCPSREREISAGQKPKEAKGGAFIGELL